MKWRLGLDLGTASVGAVALELDQENLPTSLLWHAGRIFKEPNEKGPSGRTPKKAARRLARQARRLRDRRAGRLRSIAHLSPLLGIEGQHGAPVPRKATDLTLIRARAARERVDLPDLLRVFLRMSKRRGYSGGFRGSDGQNEMGQVQGGASDLQKQMDRLALQRSTSEVTLGEFLLHRKENGQPTRLKTDASGQANLYALRDMVESEFRTIWREQSKHYPILAELHQGRSKEDVFFETLFYQRPLKSPAPMVGRCPLEPTLPRASRAHPAYQRFRVEKILADLRWGAGRYAEPISPQQRSVIRKLLLDHKQLTNKGEIKFNKIYKALAIADISNSDGQLLNLDRPARDYLTGDGTTKCWARLGLIDEWEALSASAQTTVVNLLADLGSPEQLDDPHWYNKIMRAKPTTDGKLVPRSFSAEVIDFVNQLVAANGYGRMTSMGFAGGRAGYSVKALNRLSDWLQYAGDEALSAQVRDESAAVLQCYPDAGKVELEARFDKPPKTGNDVVDVALNQLYWVVQEAIEHIGSAPHSIIVEYARELSLSAAKRAKIEALITKNQKRRKVAVKEIQAVGGTVGGTSITRYLLWDEQDTACPYCTRPLTLTDALDGARSQFEHILPRSLTHVGRKRSELVIAHSDCNSEKGNRTPYQAFGRDDDRWRHIELFARSMVKKNLARKAQLLLAREELNEPIDDQSINEFADRQLHQSAWIAREAGAWLKTLTPDVFSARGQFTAKLRSNWNLDTVIPQLRYAEDKPVLDLDGDRIARDFFERHISGNQQLEEGEVRQVPEKRLDHRHHIVDAAVIALSDRRTYLAMARAYKEEERQVTAGLKRYAKASIPPPLSTIRAELVEALQASSCNLTHKPDRYADGRFFEDTAYGLATVIEGDEAIEVLTKKVDVKSYFANKSLEKTIEKLSEVMSEDVRSLLITSISERVGRGISVEEAFDEPIIHPLYNTPIKKVKVRYKTKASLAEIVEHTDRNGLNRKALIPDGFACLGIALDESGKVAPRLYRKHEIAQGDSGRFRDGEQLVYKGDTLVELETGKKYVVAQIKSRSGGLLILVPDTETSPVAELERLGGLLKTPSGAGLLKFGATNVGESRSIAGGKPSSEDR